MVYDLGFRRIIATVCRVSIILIKISIDMIYLRNNMKLSI